MQAATPAPAISPDIRSRLDQASARAAANDCPGALAALPTDDDVPEPLRLGIKRLRFECLARAGQLEEAARLRDELEAAGIRDIAVTLFPIQRALTEGRFAVASDTLIGIAERRPAVLAEANSQLWYTVAGALTRAGELERRDRVGLALARAAWQPSDGVDLRESLALASISALITESRSGEAAPFLDDVRHPGSLFSLAIERRYAPLWSAVEAKMGPGGTLAVDKWAATALETYASAPPTPETRESAAQAYVLLGRLADAIALGEAVQVGPDMDADDADLVMQQARALIAAKRYPEAQARLRAMTALDAAKVSGAVQADVTLAEHLDEIGQAADALAAARVGLARTGNVITPFGRAWLKRTEVCALSTLGQRDAARAAGDALRDAVTENRAAAVEALLCSGRSDDAAALAIPLLGTRIGAEALANQFQPAGAIWAAGPSRLRDLWGVFLKRPDVKAAFDKAARILPRGLWPAPGERPIPRLAGAADTA